jgi:hypothetical protein
VNSGKETGCRVQNQVEPRSGNQWPGVSTGKSSYRTVAWPQAISGDTKDEASNPIAYRTFSSRLLITGGVREFPQLPSFHAKSQVLNIHVCKAF